MNLSKLGKSLILGSAIALTLTPINPQSAKATTIAECAKVQQAVKASSALIQKSLENKTFGRVVVRQVGSITPNSCGTTIATIIKFKGIIKTRFRRKVPVRGVLIARANLLSAGKKLCLRNFKARPIQVNPLENPKKIPALTQMKVSNRCFTIDISDN